MLRTGYTLEDGRCERISLAGNLGIDEVRVDASGLADVLRDPGRPPAIVVATRLPLYAPVIERGARDVILIHTSDEAYDVSAAALYRHRKVRLVVRNYRISTLPVLLAAAIVWPALAAKWMYAYWRPQASWRDNLRHCKRMLKSRRYLWRQVRFAFLVARMHGQVIDCPLNATDAFHAALPGAPATKVVPVSFAGSVHSAERVYAQATAAALGIGHGYAGWGWHATDALSAEAYVRLLASSRFILSPTGHVNMECFRFYEALLVGALPIVPSWTPFQPFGYWRGLYDVDRRLVVSTFARPHVQRAIASIADEERPILVERIRRSIETRNLMARRAIEDCICGAP